MFQFSVKFEFFAQQILDFMILAMLCIFCPSVCLLVGWFIYYTFLFVLKCGEQPRRHRGYQRAMHALQRHMVPLNSCQCVCVCVCV